MNSMEYDPDHDHRHSPSFRHRIKSSFFASCCFTASYHVEPTSPTSSSASDDDGFHRKRLLSRSSPSSWIRSRAHHLPDRCASFFSKLGARSGRQSTNTSEFRYDPFSYALNFEDDSADDFPVMAFSSRLPPSPPAISRDFVACS